MQNGLGKGLLDQVKFSCFQALCFLLTLPKYGGFFYDVIKVRFSDIREVVISSNTVPLPLPFSLNQTKHILPSDREDHGALCP